MNRRQARIFALSLINGTDDNLLGFDAPWRGDYPEDAERIERALVHYYDILHAKYLRLKDAEKGDGE